MTGEGLPWDTIAIEQVSDSAITEVRSKQGGKYHSKPQGFALQFNLRDPVEAGRIFKVLAENGAVQMPLQETFWAHRFGVLVDQFGIPWLINKKS